MLFTVIIVVEISLVSKRWSCGIGVAANKSGLMYRLGAGSTIVSGFCCFTFSEEEVTPPLGPTVCNGGRPNIKLSLFGSVGTGGCAVSLVLVVDWRL